MTLDMAKEMTVVTVVGDDGLQEKAVDDVFSNSVCCSVLLQTLLQGRSFRALTWGQC